jgi:hypothetical protein
MRKKTSSEEEKILERLFKYLGLRTAERKEYRQYYKECIAEGSERVTALRKTIEVVLSEQDKNGDLNVNFVLVLFDNKIR